MCVFLFFSVHSTEIYLSSEKKPTFDLKVTYYIHNNNNKWWLMTTLFYSKLLLLLFVFARARCLRKKKEWNGTENQRSFFFLYSLSKWVLPVVGWLWFHKWKSYTTIIRLYIVKNEMIMTIMNDDDQILNIKKGLILIEQYLWWVPFVQWFVPFLMDRSIIIMNNKTFYHRKRFFVLFLENFLWTQFFFLNEKKMKKLFIFFSFNSK